MAALALRLPVLGVRKVAPTADVDKLAGSDQHVAGGDDIHNRGFRWICVREPDGDGDVVRRATEHDGEQTMHTQHQLRSAIVEDVDVRLRAESRVCCQHGVDMTVHNVLVRVRRNVLAQPPSGQCPVVAGTHGIG